MKQAFNPYLPSFEYVPDGEPHVFGNRLYVFGSHDRFDGKDFCLNDYVTWSAPIDDLGDWKYEGVIYKKTQDPENPEGKKDIFAPDAAEGPDGKYYLYYSLADSHKVGVAVCNTPAGKYTFLGYVKDKNGIPLGQRKEDVEPFDPSVLVDDNGKVYLYAGCGERVKKDAAKTNKASICVELSSDMLTMKSEPKQIIPTHKNSAGTEFEGHEFFEASSVRQYNGKYYFVYSTVHMHELVYAMSDKPDSGFRYQGVLVSNGDIKGNPEINSFVKPRLDMFNFIGNNHGGLVKIKDKYFIFYHRQTNRNMYSRQACAEEIVMLPDGRFEQAELTSCGLNRKPLCDTGVYGAYIACHLQSKSGCVIGAHPMLQNQKYPAFTQDGADREDNPNQHIENMRNGATACFRYFDFTAQRRVSVTTRGKSNGKFIIKDESGKIVAEIPLSPSKEWIKSQEVPLLIENGKRMLYFIYSGSGYADFLNFDLK